MSMSAEELQIRNAIAPLVKAYLEMDDETRQTVIDGLDEKQREVFVNLAKEAELMTSILNSLADSNVELNGISFVEDDGSGYTVNADGTYTPYVAPEEDAS